MTANWNQDFHKVFSTLQPVSMERNRGRSPIIFKTTIRTLLSVVFQALQKVTQCHPSIPLMSDSRTHRVCQKRSSPKEIHLNKMPDTLSVTYTFTSRSVCIISSVALTKERAFSVFTLGDLGATSTVYKAFVYICKTPKILFFILFWIGLIDLIYEARQTSDTEKYWSAKLSLNFKRHLRSLKVTLSQSDFQRAEEATEIQATRKLAS